MNILDVITGNLSDVVSVGYAVEVTVFVDHCEGVFTAQEFINWARANQGVAADNSYQVYQKRISKSNVFMIHRLT